MVLSMLVAGDMVWFMEATVPSNLQSLFDIAPFSSEYRTDLVLRSYRGGIQERMKLCVERRSTRREPTT